MAMEQYLSRSLLHNTPLEDGTNDWKSSSTPTGINPSGGFDCNICLDTVKDPVVTICGHLYCWPCIYKWIQQQSISPEIPLDHQPQCPVCKAEVSERTLIPLYGRGQSVTGSDEKATHCGPIIPHRPVRELVSTSTTMTTSQRTTQRDSQHHHGYPRYPPQPEAYYPDYGDYDYTSAPAISLAGSTTFHLMISMVGEMICTRLFGSSQPFYTYPNSYGMVATRNTRTRRHMIQADQSLSRLSIFLWCCLVLCLVFF